MRKPMRTALAPAVIEAAVGGAAGYGSQDSRSGRPLDERFNQVWAGGAGSAHWGC
jgi:hypothetical protein